MAKIQHYYGQNFDAALPLEKCCGSEEIDAIYIIDGAAYINAHSMYVRADLGGVSGMTLETMEGLNGRFLTADMFVKLRNSATFSITEKGYQCYDWEGDNIKKGIIIPFKTHDYMWLGKSIKDAFDNICKGITNYNNNTHHIDAKSLSIATQVVSYKSKRISITENRAGIFLSPYDGDYIKVAIPNHYHD